MITRCKLFGKQADGHQIKEPAWHFKVWSSEQSKTVPSGRKISQRESLSTRQTWKREEQTPKINKFGIIFNWRKRKHDEAISPFSRIILINRPSQNVSHSGNQSYFPIRLAKAQFLSCSFIFFPFSWIYEVIYSSLCVLVSAARKSFLNIYVQDKMWKLLHCGENPKNAEWSSAILTPADGHGAHSHPCNMPKNIQAKSCKEHEKKAEKKKIIFMKFISKQQEFLCYLFAKRRWSWFCFQLCSARWGANKQGKNIYFGWWWTFCWCRIEIIR